MLPERCFREATTAMGYEQPSCQCASACAQSEFVIRQSSALRGLLRWCLMDELTHAYRCATVGERVGPTFVLSWRESKKLNLGEELGTCRIKYASFERAAWKAV